MITSKINGNNMAINVIKVSSHNDPVIIFYSIVYDDVDNPCNAGTC